MKVKVLITGVAGLMGSRLADWIIANVPNVEVYGIDDLSGGYINNVHPEVKLYTCNLSDNSSALYSALNQPYDYVFHLAAYAAEGLSPFIRCYNYQNNLISTARIVNACVNSGVKRLIFTSSMAVYGVGKPPFHEDDLPSPIDPYGIAKYACEQDIRIAGEQHGLDWCIIRPHNFYGIKQNIWDKYRNVLGIWMYQHLNGQPMTIFGDGLQKRAFSYIDDCLECFWKAATQENCSKQIINLGGIKEVTIKDASEVLREVIGAGEIVHLEPRHEVKIAHASYEKSVELLGFEHKTDLHDGLTRMWQWAKEQPMRERFVWSHYEIEKGIYGYWKV